MILGGLALVLIIPMIILFAMAIPIIIAIFVYKDAAKRTDCNPWLWAIVAALVPTYIGLIVYLIVRNDYPLKEEFGGPRPDSTYYQQNYESRVHHEGFPTWAKVLIVIAIIAAAIAIIAFALCGVNYVTSASHTFNTLNNF